MIDGVTRHMLPHLPRVPHLDVNRPLTYCFCDVLVAVAMVVAKTPYNRGMRRVGQGKPLSHMKLFTEANWIYRSNLVDISAI